jgi:flotillin
MTYTLILVGVIALGVFAMMAALISRYKRCPSDKLLVVYGKTKGGTAQVHHGGGTFIWPVIQDYAFLDLKPMAIDIDLRGALTSQNIRIDVPSTFTIAISSDPGTMKNAAERLLGMNQQSIAMLAKDLILGQLRLVIATMTVEEINADRDKFLMGIQHNLETELTKIGLHLVNVNVTDIHDESGYIEALGKEAAAKAINDAKVSVAQKNRDGDIGQAEANKEQRIKTSELHSAAQVGEAEAAANAEIGAKDAESKQRIRTSELNAKAVEGENTAAIAIAQTTADRKVQEAEANKKATIAQNVAAAKSQQESYAAQKLAEDARADRDKATQYANEVVPAEIAKQKAIVDAQAEAEQMREIARAEADAIFAKEEAKARGLKEILSKQAEGFETLVKSAGGDPDKAVQLMIADKLPELMKIQVEAIKNIKIDKITVWDSMGSGNGGGSTTAGFLNGMLGSLPAFDELYKMTGNKLPGLLDTRDTETVEVEESQDTPDQPQEN